MSHSQDRLTPKQAKEIATKIAGLNPDASASLELYIQTRRLNRALIRDHLLEQDAHPSKRKAILLLEGTVAITKKLKIDGQNIRERVQLAEVSGVQIVGIECMADSKATKYTVVARSGFVDYLQITDQGLLESLYESMHNIVLEKERKHNAEMERRYARGMSKHVEEQKKKLADRLSLPNIKLFGAKAKEKPRKSRTYESSTQLIKPIKTSRPQQLSLQMSQKFSAREEGQVFFMKPLAIKSSRMAPKNNPEPTFERSEKLFKEHLKSIIKRKLVYERKQLGVLKAFRQNLDNQVVVHEARPHEGSEVDEYFRFEQ